MVSGRSFSLSRPPHCPPSTRFVGSKSLFHLASFFPCSNPCPPHVASKSLTDARRILQNIAAFNSSHVTKERTANCHFQHHEWLLLKDAAPACSTTSQLPAPEATVGSSVVAVGEKGTTALDGMWQGRRKACRALHTCP